MYGLPPLSYLPTNFSAARAIALSSIMAVFQTVKNLSSRNHFIITMRLEKNQPAPYHTHSLLKILYLMFFITYGSLKINETLNEFFLCFGRGSMGGHGGLVCVRKSEMVPCILISPVQNTPNTVSTQIKFTGSIFHALKSFPSVITYNWSLKSLNRGIT